MLTNFLNGEIKNIAQNFTQRFHSPNESYAFIMQSILEIEEIYFLLERNIESYWFAVRKNIVMQQDVSILKASDLIMDIILEYIRLAALCENASLKGAGTQ